MSKKVLFVCPYPEGVAPSQRLKFEQYYPYFREAGFEVETSAFINEAFWKIIYKPGNFFAKAQYTLRGYLARLRDLWRVRRYDIVYIHLWATPFGPPVFEWLFHKLARRVVYDIDDLVYLGNVKSRAHPVVSWIKGRKKPIYLMKHADHVITCTPYLDGFVRKLNTSTTDISSTINTDLYRPKADYGIKDGIVIGWSGSHSTSRYLHLLDAVFKNLARRYDFTLLVMGDPDFRIEGVNVKALPWKASYEVDVIRSFDIGVYPLPDEEWVLGKSGLKALQYMALGVPTVATAIGTIFRIIRNGENGFLADSPEAWAAHLQKLMEDASLREAIGKAAVHTVADEYSIRANVAKYVNILEALS